MKTLIELYESLLNSVGMVVDSEGFISTRLPGSDTSKPVNIENRRWVLPLKQQLNEPDWSSRIGFHPLLQKVEEGESRSVDKFRDRLNVYADFMLGAFLLNLCKLACEKEKHINLTPAQAVYLGPFSDADPKLLKFITTLIKTSRIEKKGFEFLRFSLLRGRNYQGKKRSRVAVLHFPLYDELPGDGSGTTILDQKLRAKDVKMLRSIYEFLFPGIGEREQWEVPSDSLIAASMESLMTIYAKFVNIHNNAVAVLGPWLEAGEELSIVNDWQEGIASIASYRNEIQTIPWLEGAKTTPTPAATAAPAMINTVPQHATPPVYKETPVVNNQIPGSYPINAPANQAQPAPRYKIGIESPVVTQAPQHVTLDNKVNLHTNGLQAVGSTYVDPNQLQQQQYQLQQQQLQLQQYQLQQQQLQQQQQQAAKLPDTARLINGAVYIPVEGSGVSQVPMGAMVVDGKLYMPLQQQQVAQPQFPQPVGIVQQQQPFGMQQNQQPQPSQLPNLTPQEVAYYNANPVAYQNYLAQLQQGAVNQIQQQQNVRQAQVPRYLRNAVQAAQQATQQTSNGFFYNR